MAGRIIRHFFNGYAVVVGFCLNEGVAGQVIRLFFNGHAVIVGF